MSTASDATEPPRVAALAALSLRARALDIPTDGHPNKMPFSGILTFLDEPSDGAPEGAGGQRVMIAAKAATKECLDNLLGMAVDYTPGWDGHDPQKKIGVITAAEIKQIDGRQAIWVSGFIYAADFPTVAAEIKANKANLGMSFEARDLWTPDPKANPVQIVDCVFTGAAILLKDKAAYRTTSISAARADKEDFSTMALDKETQDQLAAIVAAAVKPLNDTVQAQAKAIEKLEADKVAAANLLAKVGPHADRLDSAADAMEKDGIGGEARRGHVAVLRDMAGGMRADAAQGKMPHIYSGASMYAAEARANADKGQIEGEVAKAVAPLNAKIETLTAAAEKAAGDAKDALASKDTQIADLTKKLEKAQAAANDAPAQKTLTPGQSRLLAKTTLELPTDGSKLPIGKIDQAFAQAGLDTDQRWELKSALARLGVID